MLRGAALRLQWIAFASMVATVAALASAAAAERASGTPQNRLLVYGYPYAAACPAAGIADRIDRLQTMMKAR